MRIVPTALVSIAFLGVAISPGWCPEPADLKSEKAGSYGATAAASWKPSPPNRVRENVRLRDSGYGERLKPGQANTRAPVLATSSSSAAMDRLGGGSSYAPPGGGIKKTGAKSGDARTSQAPPRASVATGGPRMPIASGGCPGCGKHDTVRHPR
jgi:hypothetical protein